MKAADYWRECIANAVEECGGRLTPEQVDYVAAAVEGAHDHYDQAFYHPPASDRYAVLEREHRAALERAEGLRRQTEVAAERALKAALNLRKDDLISFNVEGEVFRHGGRTKQIL